MPPPRSPTLWSRFRQTVGRALRETGQALERVGVRGEQHALRPRRVGDDPYMFDDFLSRHRHLFPLLQRGSPKVSPQVAYLAPCSTLIGSVNIGADSSVWYGAVLRGDACENGREFESITLSEPWEMDDLQVLVNEGRPVGGGIFIGEQTHVQDGCVVTAREAHTQIGNGVTIEPLAQIHSATIKDYSLIGTGSYISPHATVESFSVVAAGAVVPEGTVVPSGELWMGNPATKQRDLPLEEQERLKQQASDYVKVALGQQGVMELGGNLPEFVIDNMLLQQEHKKKEEYVDQETEEAVAIKDEEVIRQQQQEEEAQREEREIEDNMQEERVAASRHVG